MINGVFNAMFQELFVNLHSPKYYLLNRDTHFSETNPPACFLQIIKDGAVGLVHFARAD